MLSQCRRLIGPCYRLRLRIFFVLIAISTLQGLPAVSHAAEALSQPGTEPGAFYWRVLSLPKAVMRQQPEEQADAVLREVPAFTTYYVYAKKENSGESWVKVGKKPKDGATGWIKASDTEDWRSMLVMQYTPRGRRNRVMFFKDKAPLLDIVEGHFPAKARELLERAETGNPDRDKLVALEPEAAVRVTDKPYLMPIFEFEHAEFGDEAATPTALLQVGGLNLKNAPEPSSSPTGPSMQNFKIGITFVIDTTASMGPYIDATRSAVKQIYKQLEKDGTIKKVSFGLVGYRDDTSYDTLIEYVSKVYQPLDPNAPVDLVLRNIEKVKPSTVPTRGWNEDAYAGILAAINDLNWEPFSGRIIILMSDAGARNADDPYAKHANISHQFVTERARQKNIAILPLHMKTPQAQRAGNLESTQSQFSSLGKMRDADDSKYVGIDAGDVAALARKLAQLSSRMASTIKTIAHDQQPTQSPNPPSNEPDKDLANFLVNEIFRARLEYIGARNHEQAPRFFRAWVTPRDMVRPRFYALNASVFLTRNQLNGLAKSLSEILVRGRAAQEDASGLFDLLRSLAATTAVDPTRSGQAGEFENIADSGLLPKFLEALPYHSKILSLTADNWRDWEPSRRRQELVEMNQKLQMYKIINEDTDNWLDLGAGDSGLQVYPIPLAYLP
jgi:serine/threonine-protein kinase PpkA